MNRLIDALIRFLEAVGRTPGEEFSHGLGTYRLIEHPREERIAPRARPWAKRTRCFALPADALPELARIAIALTGAGISAMGIALLGRGGTTSDGSGPVAQHDERDAGPG